MTDPPREPSDPSRASRLPELGQVLASLYARVPLGMRLGLEPMQRACAAAGNPEAAFESVHVAGTNGKGSVSAMVEAIARAAGKKTGMYTSPHLCRFAERIRIDGEPIDDVTLAALLSRVLAGAPDLSFFETATLAAFLAFREAKVDLAVVEVGIGGRLDATNVLARPCAAAITRIAFDHMDRLGPTLADIAREKAGIAKPGLDLVLGPIAGEALAAIRQVAASAGAKTTLASRIPAAVAFASRSKIGLLGAHQKDNAQVAYLLGERIGANEAARAGGIEGVRWPGRLETLTTKDGVVLLDAAHNPDGAEALARYLASAKHRERFPPARTALVFGALADKEWAVMLDRLAPLAAFRVYVRPEGRAPAKLEELAARAPGSAAASVREALTLARQAVGATGLVVLAGSIFLVGEARAELLSLPRDPAVAL